MFYYRTEENLFRCFEIIVADHNKVTVMTLRPFTNEQLNYFKFAFDVRTWGPRSSPLDLRFFVIGAKKKREN